MNTVPFSTRGAAGFFAAERFGMEDQTLLKNPAWSMRRPFSSWTQRRGSLTVRVCARAMRIRKVLVTAANPRQRTLPLQTLIDQAGEAKSALQVILEEAAGAGV